jgi:hypothetical protein
VTALPGPAGPVDSTPTALDLTATDSGAEKLAAQLVLTTYPASNKGRSFFFFGAETPRRTLRRRLDRALGEAPDDAMGVLITLIADCDLRAYDTRRASKRWGSAYYLLGLPAAVFATIAGAAGLASTAGRIPAAIVALAAAGLATAATFLNSNDNKQQNGKLSAAWQELADDVRLAVIKYRRGKGAMLVDDNSLINDVIYFNKRKSALMRGDLSIPERGLQA